MVDTTCICERGPVTVKFLESDVEILLCSVTPAQWLAGKAKLTVLEEMQATKAAA